jgi:hypothetical protein
VKKKEVGLGELLHVEVKQKQFVIVEVVVVVVVVEQPYM